MRTFIHGWRVSLYVVSISSPFPHSLPVVLQTSDPILRGKAIVSLTAARKIKRIRVVLEGYCDQWGGPGTTYETDIPILQNELKQDLNETFEAGDHL